jgi:tetratricopeptide (TPR) repeat protein
MRNIIITMTLALGLFFQVAAEAGHHNETELDSLFTALKSARSVAEAEPLEFAIWQAWMKSGDGAKDSMMHLGVSALEVGNLSVALAAFDALVEEAPGFSEAWNKRATVYFMMGDYDSSVADIMQTLSLEPRHFGALSGLGMIFVNIGKKDAAIAAFEKALSIHPQLPGIAAFVEESRGEFQGKGI